MLWLKEMLILFQKFVFQDSQNMFLEILRASNMTLFLAIGIFVGTMLAVIFTAITPFLMV